ncbi:hypothetical protein [Streptomyces beigongshangae]|uniref:hypothetical protein n=1 Tax=Streptomyces beigongshangae TaxID=2841597 RepID=UPI0027E0EFA1|nr:hypothetical protein [Streptomyces sp. REN17]
MTAEAGRGRTDRGADAAVPSAPLAPSARLRRTTRGALAVGAELARRLRRYAWPSAKGRRNRVYLRDRLVALPLLAVLAFGALGWAYADVRGDSAHLRERLAPALVGLANARTSLFIAQGEAEENLDAAGAAGLGGLSERYRTRVARATQSLNQVTRSGALTVAEEQELRVVSALVVDYTGWIARARGHADDAVLRDAELTYARSMLCSEPIADEDRYPACRAATGSGATSIVDRVAGLERRLGDRLAARAAWGWGVLTAAAVAGPALVLFAAGLWRTVVFLRRRFRIRLSIPLAVAALPLLAVPLLTADALLAQRAQARSAPLADALAERTSPETETIAEERPFDGPDPRAVGVLESRIDGTLSDGRLAFLDGVAPFVLPVGLAGAGLVGGALHAYRREYLVVARPGAVA